MGILHWDTRMRHNERQAFLDGLFASLRAQALAEWDEKLNRAQAAAHRELWPAAEGFNPADYEGMK